MRCRSCSSENLGHFNGELAIHFHGLENVNKRAVFIFSALTICRDCGFGEFVVPGTELQALAKGKAVGAK